MKPTRSANSTVTMRRSSPCADATAWPHDGQNRAPRGRRRRTTGRSSPASSPVPDAGCITDSSVEPSASGRTTPAGSRRVASTSGDRRAPRPRSVGDALIPAAADAVARGPSLALLAVARRTSFGDVGHDGDGRRSERRGRAPLPRRDDPAGVAPAMRRSRARRGRRCPVRARGDGRRRSGLDGRADRRATRSAPPRRRRTRAWIGGVVLARSRRVRRSPGSSSARRPSARSCRRSCSFPAAIIFGDGMRRRRERARRAGRAGRAGRARARAARPPAGAGRADPHRPRAARRRRPHGQRDGHPGGARPGGSWSTNPARATQALLEAIETTGRAAMNEMRRILGVLREDDGARRWSARRHRRSTMLPDAGRARSRPPRVAATLDGDLRRRPAGRRAHAYRVVQEALTNVRRHAGPVHDGARSASRDATTPGGRGDRRRTRREHAGRRRRGDAGHGLVGMRERVGDVGRSSSPPGRVTAAGGGCTRCSRSRATRDVAEPASAADDVTSARPA